MNLSKVTRERVVAAMKRLNYVVFERGQHNVNLVGVRSAERRADKFDDAICLFYPDGAGWTFHALPATTDPGAYYLQNPMQARGAAIMVPGQYRGLWRIGMHFQQRALVQVRPVKIYRDGNRDAILDMNPVDIMTGLYGINLHSHWQMQDPATIGKWSAGCQVVQRKTDFARLMAACGKASKFYGPDFSYTLLTEAQVFG